MTDQTVPDPEPGAARRRRAWRVGTPVVIMLSGALLAVSYANSEGTDLRPGRYTDLASLAQGEAEDYEQVRADVAALDAEVEQLGAAIPGQRVARLRAEVERLEGPSGLEAVSGSGVTVTLADAPASNVDGARSAGIDLNRLVVHQQDIQSVVNAMWQAGATAVTIQGQRVVSTTGIKCEGNAVQLQGIPYPQPYVISAVGDASALQAAIDADADTSLYRADSEDPLIEIGWDLDYEEQIEAPAYDGLLDLAYAQPLR